jgi:hypothetical protein
MTDVSKQNFVYAVFAPDPTKEGAHLCRCEAGSTVFHSVGWFDATKGAQAASVLFNRDEGKKIHAKLKAVS